MWPSISTAPVLNAAYVVAFGPFKYLPKYSCNNSSGVVPEGGGVVNFGGNKLSSISWNSVCFTFGGIISAAAPMIALMFSFRLRIYGC